LKRPDDENAKSDLVESGAPQGISPEGSQIRAGTSAWRDVSRSPLSPAWCPSRRIGRARARSVSSRGASTFDERSLSCVRVASGRQTRLRPEPEENASMQEREDCPICRSTSIEYDYSAPTTRSGIDAR